MKNDGEVVVVPTRLSKDTQGNRIAKTSPPLKSIFSPGLLGESDHLKKQYPSVMRLDLAIPTAEEK